MSTILYTVTAEILKPEHESSWRSWMLEQHMQEVKDAGAKCAYLVKEDGTKRFHAMYEFESREALKRYLEEKAPGLRKKGADQFSADSIAYSRSTGELFTLSQ